MSHERLRARELEQSYRSELVNCGSYDRNISKAMVDSEASDTLQAARPPFFQGVIERHEVPVAVHISN